MHFIESPFSQSHTASSFQLHALQLFNRTLQRTAISVNMKERLDFSCALFTMDGGLVANAPHIPVHLGAMQAAVRYQVEYWSKHGGIQDGDVLVSNHPQKAGGSHLPDITVITPVFHEGGMIFLVASRGHHADIGGISPGTYIFTTAYYPARLISLLLHCRIYATTFKVIRRRGCHDYCLQAS